MIRRWGRLGNPVQPRLPRTLHKPHQGPCTSPPILLVYILVLYLVTPRDEDATYVQEEETRKPQAQEATSETQGQAQGAQDQGRDEVGRSPGVSILGLNPDLAPSFLRRLRNGDVQDAIPARGRHALVAHGAG